MSVDISVLLLGGINVATLAFGYGVLWTQVKALKELVSKLEALIDSIVTHRLEDHEHRLIRIEEKHERCNT